MIDLLTGQLALPEGAKFEIKPQYWREACGYYQPRVMRHSRPGMPPVFAIHDVYFDATGQVIGYTKHARSDRTQSVDDLKELITRQALEARESVRCADLDQKHTAEQHHKHWLEHIDDEVLEYDEKSAHIKIT